MDVYKPSGSNFNSIVKCYSTMKHTYSFCNYKYYLTENI